MAGEDFTGLVILVIVGAAFAAILVAASRYKKVPPNMAMVVYGKRQKKTGGRGYRVISGGAKVIVPIVESVEWLKLDVRTLDLVVPDIVTDVKRSGAKINIKAVAQVKISSDEATLNTAAENLLGKSEQQVDEIALKTLEGHVRGVCATLTVEEVNSDRDAIASKILGMAGNDLRNMGIEIRSFVIKEIEDAMGYL
ncbi:MAG TPA: flotillin family protein, partial [Thermoplasmata archaeon]|nr:flotillin family protein [Thermoplasmata archaeon]